VLVADDEPSMLELVASHLKSHENPKLDVLEASDGEEAWLLARERLPDLVVLDVMMPGMSGWEVCRKIREDVALAHTGVVMLTGIGENLNQMTSPLYGADAYLDKPFDFSELDEKVKEALLARATLRGAVARPSAPVNGVAGPAKVAPVARKAAKKAAKAPAKKAAKNSVAKKAAAPRPAKKSALKPAPRKGAAKSAPTRAPAKKVAVKKAAKTSGKPRAAKKSQARKAPSKRR
jgi:DNA-binding response OmpR family regulator